MSDDFFDRYGVWIFLVACAVILTVAAVPVRGQEGHFGQGHEDWHADFYNPLQLNGFSCCHLADCRPTSGRAIGDKYQVKIDGQWVDVLPEKIVKVTAPDADYHVCAPKLFDGDPQHVYCVVLPPEG